MRGVGRRRRGKIATLLFSDHYLAIFSGVMPHHSSVIPGTDGNRRWALGDDCPVVRLRPRSDFDRWEIVGRSSGDCWAIIGRWRSAPSITGGKWVEIHRSKYQDRNTPVEYGLIAGGMGRFLAAIMGVGRTIEGPMIGIAWGNLSIIALQNTANGLKHQSIQQQVCRIENIGSGCFTVRSIPICRQRSPYP